MNEQIKKSPHGTIISQHRSMFFLIWPKMQAFHQLTLLEGIIPALESSHAVAYGTKLAAGMGADQNIIINLSGRGDKDIETVARIEGITL